MIADRAFRNEGADVKAFQDDVVEFCRLGCVPDEIALKLGQLGEPGVDIGKQYGIFLGGLFRWLDGHRDMGTSIVVRGVIGKRCAVSYNLR